MELTYVLLSPGASPPKHAHDGDAGWDLCAASDVVLPAAGGRAAVDTGLAIAIPRDHVGLICPRSGLAANHGVTVLNAPGVVDSGYRGQLRVLLLNTDTSNDYHLSVGDRIAQLLILPIAVLTPVLVRTLPTSPRGTKGFGSSGR